MRTLTGAAVLAALTLTTPSVRAQDAPLVERVNPHRSWSELIDAAAKEIAIAIVYDAGYADEQIAIATGGQRTSARALLERMLSLRSMRLDVDLATKTGRIVMHRTEPGEVVVGSVGAPAERTDPPAGALVTRTIELKYVEARLVYNAVSALVRKRSAEWIRNVDRSSIIVTVAPDRLALLEQVIARLDRPGPETEVAEVAVLKHGNAMNLSAMITGLAPKAGRWVRARPNPSNTSIALVGQSRYVAQARALLASLDVPGASARPHRQGWQSRVVKLQHLSIRDMAAALRHQEVRLAMPDEEGRTLVLTGTPQVLDAAQALIKQLDVRADGATKKK